MTYDSEITYDDILGDMNVIWLGDDISFEHKCLRQNLRRGYISNQDYKIMIELINEFFNEIIYVRINEFEKWFDNY